MGEILKCMYPVIRRPNGFVGLDGMYVPSSSGNCRTRWSRHHCGLCVLVRKKYRGRDVIGELDMVSVLLKRQARLLCREWSLPHTSFTPLSTRVGRSFDIINAVASQETNLLCQESKENVVIRTEFDELNVGSFVQNLPPWGNLMAFGEPDIDFQGVDQPPTKSKDMVTLKESEVQFLEEINEEELSRRILALSRSNKVRSALYLFKSMEFSGLRSNAHACNSLLSCLLRNNFLDNAMRVFQFMKQNELTTSHTYSLILKAVADAQSCNSTINMFAQMEGFNKEGKDLDIIVYNTMISICGRVNNWVEAERIWRKLQENDHHGTTITYSLLVAIFVRCGQNELAIDAYTEMVKKGLNPRKDAMQAAIGACTKEGKWDFALSIFQSMLNSGLKPNLIACNALINSLGKSAKVELAFDVFGKLKSLGHKPDTYTWNALLSCLYRSNQYADTLQMFESLKREQSSQLNEHLFNIALMSCQKLGLWDRALQLLWQMEASGLLVSTSSYNIVIGACETARKPKVALQVYEHMVHQNCPPDTFTYLSLLRACIWASLWTEVEEIIDLVAPDVSIYNAVIHGMCLRGKVDSAKKLYLKMRQGGLKPDGKTRALMLQNLRKASTKRKKI